MGVNRPSLYAAFGDKEALFRKARDRFVNGPAAYTQKALKEPTVRAVVERLLQGAADLNAAAQSRWCLMAQRALACNPAGTAHKHFICLQSVSLFFRAITIWLHLQVRNSQTT
jgi:AcrR family transcriptional regulator